jgi:hypothetical protein
MKNLRIITGIALMSIFGFTSCQNEVNDVQGDNPNAANSTTANNMKRTSMYDGSKDDYIDGNSCSSIVLPAAVIANGTKVNLFTQLDYLTVISILGKYNDDQDAVTLQFPLKVKMSNYTEVEAKNQAEYNTILKACSSAEASGQDAISSVNINFPITILTYNLSLQQTGSVVITSEQKLYTYMSSISSTELFSVNYPMSVTLLGGSETEVSSDAEFQAAITASLKTEATMDEAEEDSKKMEAILVKGMFKVESYVSAGVDSANDYKDFTIDFANDMSIKVVNAGSTAATGTYEASSELDVFLELNFSGNASFNLLDNTYKVVTFSATSISLQSSTNAATTLVLKQI